MIDGTVEDRDLSVLVVPRVGAVEAGSDLWEPVRLINGGGGLVAPVTAFLRELQAAGRSAATQRSYAMTCCGGSGSGGPSTSGGTRRLGSRLATSAAG